MKQSRIVQVFVVAVDDTDTYVQVNFFPPN